MAQNATPAVPGKGTVTTPTPMQRWLDQLALESTMRDNVDASAITEQVIGNMLAAESLDAAIAVQDAGLPSGKDMVGIEQTVTSFEVRESDPRFSEHSLGYYFAVEAFRVDNGEHISYGVGAPNVMTVLWVARLRDEFPFSCVIRSRDTANGALLTLYRIPARAVKS